ncbi:MAG: hypothetical protein JKY83_06910, partial [Rhizobiaceae bacterium]|nr:hypothetical protein [Rhizobiaceae bacterium]
MKFGANPQVSHTDYQKYLKLRDRLKKEYGVFSGADVKPPEELDAKGRAVSPFEPEADELISKLEATATDKRVDGDFSVPPEDLAVILALNGQYPETPMHTLIDARDMYLTEHPKRLGVTFKGIKTNTNRIVDL